MTEMLLSDDQLAELERIREWACCFEPERRFMAEAKVAQLKAENERLREFYEASQAVEEGIIDFDLHHDAVERLRAAREALGGE